MVSDILVSLDWFRWVCWIGVKVGGEVTVAPAISQVTRKNRSQGR